MSDTNLIISTLGPLGDGVSLSPKGPVFIERTVPGDYLKARVFKDKNGISRGKIVSILNPSTYRKTPPCPHYEDCGGCTLQHLEQGFYRRWKLQTVKEAFQKQRLQPLKWLPPIFIGEGKRRRATFTAIKQGDKITFGYYKRRSDQITEIDSCLVSDPRLLEIKNRIKPTLKNTLLESTPTDFFVQLEQIAEFGSLKVQLPSGAFLQPTLEGEKALVSALLSAFPSKGKFADLFSGCGTFSGPLLSRGSVDAYENNADAVKALSKAAGGNPLRVFRRDLYKNPLRTAEINRYDAVVFDPPRAGCPEQAEEMSRSKVRLLVGVSCNPLTFARDARILCEGGYWLQSVQVVDQFLWSHHVEVVGVFTKKKRGRA